MSANLLQALQAAVGEAQVEQGKLTADIAGKTGTPLATVRPANAAEIANVLGVCRTFRVNLVPAGSRTAYWSPLALDGVVALDSRRLTSLEWFGKTAVVGAGFPVRTLDQQLRKAGSHLPIHPDAFGETAVGAMVASACTSGIGMGLGGFGASLAGIEVVTGAGERFWTGTTGFGAEAPLIREGLPDLTGLFLGSEGALGVISRLALLHRPPPARVHAFGTFAGQVDALVDFGREFSGVYDTFRLIQVGGSSEWAVDVWFVSPFGPAEAVARAKAAGQRLVNAGVRNLRLRAEKTDETGDSPERWAGPLGRHETFVARARLAGIDVNAPYEAASSLLSLAQRLVAAQTAAGVAETRIAFYLAPDFVNLGVHATVLHDDLRWTEANEAPFYAELAALPLIPYRSGRRWPSSPASPQLRAIKQLFDPDGILQPGLPLWR